MTESSCQGPPLLSIIVPLLNERALLPAVLPTILRLKQSHGAVEWLFVDGGSGDGSVEYLQAQGLRVIASDAGRARQMNAGAAQASGAWLLFLHIDTLLSTEALTALRRHCEERPPGWGRFDVRIHGRSSMLKVVASMMNCRSRITGIATGDMGIFVHREVFAAVSGFPEQPLMEDIEISRRLKRTGRPYCLSQPVITSGRRWDEKGVWATILLMWRLRIAYFMGRSADDIARRYYG